MADALVTGGAGFIGSLLAEQLAGRGQKVVVLDDLSWGRVKNLTAASGVRLIRDSILNIEAHAAELEGVRTIFHLAALISGYDSLREPEEYVRTNVVGLNRLIAFCRRLDRPRLVFASSSTVYGDVSIAEKHEEDRPQPPTVYALSKLAGEHLLDMYRAEVGYDDVSLRLFNVYGPRQNADHPYANVTCKFAKAAALGEKVKLYGDGEQTRDFVYVDDVVSALLTLGDRKCPARIYNVGSGADTSINSLLETVQQLAGRRLHIERCPSWPNDIRAIRASISRLRRDTGWSPTTALQTGLARTIDYFRAKALSQ